MPGRRHRHAALHADLAARVHALPRRQDVADDHLVDLLGIDPGALEDGLAHRGPQVGRGYVLQRTAERPDRRTQRGGDHDVHVTRAETHVTPLLRCTDALGYPDRAQACLHGSMVSDRPFRYVGHTRPAAAGGDGRAPETDDGCPRTHPRRRGLAVLRPRCACGRDERGRRGGRVREEPALRAVPEQGRPGRGLPRAVPGPSRRDRGRGAARPRRRPGGPARRPDRRGGPAGRRARLPRLRHAQLPRRVPGRRRRREPGRPELPARLPRSGGDPRRRASEWPTPPGWRSGSGWSSRACTPSAARPAERSNARTAVALVEEIIAGAPRRNPT